MEKIQEHKNKNNHDNLSNDGLISRAIINLPIMQAKKREVDSIINSPVMQQKEVEHKKIFGDIIQRNNTGLPDNLKTGIETLSGYSMDDVKVHFNSNKPAQLNAHAYAQGTNIHIASGQEKHLPHEAWHVIQQKQGRVKPTIQMKENININDNINLEKEADIMGKKALLTPIQKSKVESNDKLQNQNNTLQRLVITSEEISEVDEVIAADIAFQHQKAGGIIITLAKLIQKQANSYTIKNGEGIIISGHGEPGKVSGLSGVQLAQYITKIGNYQNAKYIYIASCDAATPDETNKSVVDITHEVLNAQAEVGQSIPIYGATGIAVNDFDFLTKDFQTRYKKDFENVAIFIEDLVTARVRPNVKEALNLNNIKAVSKRGKELLVDTEFREFYKTLIRALAGQLTLKEVEVLVSDIGVAINKKGVLLDKIEVSLNGIKKDLSNPIITQNPQEMKRISKLLNKIGGMLPAIKSFLNDAKALLSFIEERYINNEDISSISRTDKDELALEGYNENKEKVGKKYADL